MKNKKFFRISLFGYKKTDVNEYIITFNKQALNHADDAKREAVIEAGELRERLNLLEVQISEKEDTIQTLEKDLESLKKEYEALKEKETSKTIHSLLPGSHKNKETAPSESIAAPVMSKKNKKTIIRFKQK